MGWITMSGTHVPVGENGELQGKVAEAINDRGIRKRDIKGWKGLKEALKDGKELKFSPDDLNRYPLADRIVRSIQPGTEVKVATGDKTRTFKAKEVFRNGLFPNIGEVVFEPDRGKEKDIVDMTKFISKADSISLSKQIKPPRELKF